MVAYQLIIAKTLLRELTSVPEIPCVAPAAHLVLFMPSPSPAWSPVLRTTTSSDRRRVCCALPCQATAASYITLSDTRSATKTACTVLGAHLVWMPQAFGAMYERSLLIVPAFCRSEELSFKTPPAVGTRTAYVSALLFCLFCCELKTLSARVRLVTEAVTCDV